ncbi:MAG: hypothetical protein JWR75_99 [Devosia sp.]|nr:hypothetical protein [Devosia sp.]
MSLVAHGFETLDLTRPATAAPAAGKVTLRFIAPADWDRHAAEFDEVCQEGLYAYAKQRWPQVEHEPALFYRNGELVGGALMMLQPMPLKLGTIALAKWGPMLADTNAPDGLAIYQGMIDRLVEEYAVKRRMMLSVLPRASLAPVNNQYDHLIARGFAAGSRLLFPNRYIINLRLSDAEQRKSLAQKWRYHLNKSEKAELSFERAEFDQIGEFDALYAAMADRKRFPDHSAYDTVPALFGSEVPLLQPELFYVRHAGEIIAGAIIFKAGDRAVYLYGATNDRALPLRAGYFLHWHIIRWLRDHTEADWYDLGGTDGFQGLHQFKKGMAGDAGVITPVPRVANYAAYRFPMLIGQTAFALRDAYHSARRSLDRLHRGRARPDQPPHIETTAKPEA